MKARKCPKCKSFPCYLFENWNNFQLQFETENGLAVGDGYSNIGMPTGVIAECGNCGHVWKLKGITQISEIRNQGQFIVWRMGYGRTKM